MAKTKQKSRSRIGIDTKMWQC